MRRVGRLRLQRAAQHLRRLPGVRLPLQAGARHVHRPALQFHHAGPPFVAMCPASVRGATTPCPPSCTTTSTPRMSLPTCSPTGAPRARPAPPIPGLAAFAALVPHRRLTGFTFHANPVSNCINIFIKIALPSSTTSVPVVRDLLQLRTSTCSQHRWWPPTPTSTPTRPTTAAPNAAFAAKAGEPFSFSAPIQALWGLGDGWKAVGGSAANRNVDPP